MMDIPLSKHYQVRKRLGEKYLILVIIFASVFLNGCTGTGSHTLKTALPLPVLANQETDEPPLPIMTRMMPFEEVFRSLVPQTLDPVPSNETIKIEVWVDKEAYQVGEEVTFFFRSNRDAYIILLDIGMSGNLRILFPNQHQKEHYVDAGRIYSIPSKKASYSIEAEGPPGFERVKIIASTQPIKIGQEVPSDGFLTVSRNEHPFQEKLWKSLKKLKDQIWAEDSIEIEITEDGKPLHLPGQSRTIKPKKPEKLIDITGTAGLTEEDQKNDSPDLSPKKPEKPIDTIGSAGVIPRHK